MIKVPYEDKEIPFGKHKGELIADLSDSYLEFLLDQDWFEERFSRLYKLTEMEMIYRKKFNITMED